MFFVRGSASHFFNGEFVIEYSIDYLGAKKIVAIEDISKIILNSRECWDINLEDFVKAWDFTEQIGKLLASGKTDEEIVTEIRKIFKLYKIFIQKSI